SSLSLEALPSFVYSLSLHDALPISFWDRTGIDSFLNGMWTSIGLDKVPGTWSILFVMILVTMLIKWLTDYYLQTEVGLALRATGDNQRMIKSFAANTESLMIIGVVISNGLVALSGALIAQYGGFADVGMGIGLIIIGLASVIIGEALFGTKTIRRTTRAVIGGAIIYRIVVTMALRVDFLDAGDMKFITALLVIAALVSPKVLQARREKKRRLAKRAELAAQKSEVDNYANFT